jgi:hypothetical protein
MRYHSKHLPYLLHPRPDRAASLLKPQHLAVARLEPLLSWRYEAALDLIFEHGGAYGTISFAIVDGAYVVEREKSPFCWPVGLRALVEPHVLRELESLVEPWLKSRMLARFENDELVRYFRDVPGVRTDFERARALGLYGATPLTALLTAIAPHVYGYRFAAERSVAVMGVGGASGAALLAGRARSVAFAGDGPEHDAFVRAWFSLVDLEPLEANRRYDVVFRDEGSADAEIVIRGDGGAGRVISIARPLPAKVCVSFDPEDSIAERSFGVHAKAVAQPLRHSSLAEPHVIGGSAGRIAILMRDGWFQAADADTDALHAMQRRLGAEGFSTRVIETHGWLDPATADLVHVVGIRHAEHVRALLERVRAANVPIVVEPHLDDPRGEAEWGAAISGFSFRGAEEDATLDLYLQKMAARRLAAAGAPEAPGAEPRPDPNVAAVLASAGCVIASCASEAALIRHLYGYHGRMEIVPAFVEIAAPAPIAELAGFDEYILVNGPVDHRNAVVLVTIAAERLGLPLVLTGPVANAEAQQHLHAYAGDRLRFISVSQRSEHELEGLYAGARVFADLSWSSRSLSRFARAGGYGAALACSANGYARDVWGDLAATADSASLPSIQEALQRAWDRAPLIRPLVAARTAELFDQGAALRGTARAYQQAAQTCAVS